MQEMEKIDSTVGKFMLSIAAFIIIVAGIKAAEAIMVPFLLSVFIAVLCAPFLIFLQNKKIPTGIAIFIIIFIMIVSGFLLSGFVGSSLHAFSDQLPEYQLRLESVSLNVVKSLNQVGFNLPETNWGTFFDPGIAMKLVSQTLTAFGNLMTNAFLIVLTVVFILTEMSVFKSKMYAISKNKESSQAMLEKFLNNVNRYMAIKSWMSLLTGIVITVWLWVLGVDHPVLWGLLAFLLNFVPNLGSILAAIPAVLLALIQLGPSIALLTAGGYVLVNVVVGNILEPRFMGKGLGLSTLVVFLSLVFWGWTLGLVGMLLSIPLTMAVKIGLETRKETEWVGILLSATVSEDEK